MSMEFFIVLKWVVFYVHNLWFKTKVCLIDCIRMDIDIIGSNDLYLVLPESCIFQGKVLVRKDI
jgi:hypothetical protein